MGGEPLCKENRFLTLLIIKAVKEQLPNTKIYIWTGYLYEDLLKTYDSHLQEIFKLSDCLIDGPFVLAERDITLPMRGSRNQRIIYLNGEKDANDKE
jgi:anaerobic ribonucleoside-triphosphate reductase activating protein